MTGQKNNGTGTAKRKVVSFDIDSAEGRAAKREQILVSNRRASKKCRQKYKTREEALDARSESLMNTNRELIREARRLREELFGLKTEILAHGSVCEDFAIRKYLRDASAQL